MDDHADDADGQADQAAPQIVEGGGDAACRLRHKGGEDQAYDRGDHEEGGDEVVHLGLYLGGDRLLFSAEENQQSAEGNQSTELYAPEDAGLSKHPEEIKECHARVSAQKNAGGIAHQGGRSLQVGGDGDRDQDGNRGNL